MKTTVIALITSITLSTCYAIEVFATAPCCDSHAVIDPALIELPSGPMPESTAAQETQSTYPIYVYQCQRGHVFRFPIPGNYRCRFDGSFLKLVAVQ